MSDLLVAKALVLVFLVAWAGCFWTMRRDTYTTFAEAVVLGAAFAVGWAGLSCLLLVCVIILLA